MGGKERRKGEGRRGESGREGVVKVRGEEGGKGEREVSSKN